MRREEGRDGGMIGIHDNMIIIILWPIIGAANMAAPYGHMLTLLPFLSM